MSTALRLRLIPFARRSLTSNPFSRRRIHASVVLPKDYPEHTLLPMPALSPTMDMGTISKWELKEGDEFTAGSVFCSVETDKATMDFESQEDGFLAKILRDGPNAVDIPVGSPVAVIVEDEESVAAFADFELEEGALEDEAPAVSTDAPSQATPSETPVNREVAEEHVLLPSARFLAESKGLDATGLPGTGKGGRVTKGDVLAAIANGTQMPALVRDYKTSSFASPSTSSPVAEAPSAPAADLALPSVDTYGTYEDLANNNMRKVIAKRLSQSKREIPHFYTSMEVELDGVLKLRKELVKKHDVKVSVNDVIIRCCSLALRDVPEVNASYDSKSGTVKMQDAVDISIAVATPGGLITPIVPNTDQLGLSEITDKVRDLAGRAREGKLAPEEYQGVINQPQAAILAVGGGTRSVVPTPYVDGAEIQAKPTIKTIMTARLSADRRVVDEATASLFLSAFKHYINKPELLLLCPHLESNMRSAADITNSLTHDLTVPRLLAKAGSYFDNNQSTRATTGASSIAIKTPHQVTMPLTIPPELKKITPYVRRAEELDRDKANAESRLVAYYCRQFAVHTGIALATGESGKNCLGEILGALESEKEAMDAFTIDEAKFLCEAFAEKIFDKADMEDRDGSATRNTAKTFYAAASFLEILEQFYKDDDQSEEFAEIKKRAVYAKWKATDILKAIKEGRDPTPGGYGESDDAQESEEKEPATDVPEEPPQVETVSDDAEKESNDDPEEQPEPMIRMPSPDPSSEDGNDGFEEKMGERGLGPPPPYPMEPEPPSPTAPAPMPPAFNPPAPTPVMPPPAATEKRSGLFGFGPKKSKPTRVQLADARELTQFALAALEDKDADLAAERLAMALQALGR
eukprot:scaffold1992_cov113-Cylindrotheca_fusiformis.AAC.8